MNKEWSRSTRWRIICFQRRYSDKWLNKLQLRWINLCISLCLNIVGDIWGDVWLHSLELWLEPTPELMYKVTWAPGCSTITACKCGERRKIIHLGYLLHRGRFSTHTHTHTHQPNYPINHTGCEKHIWALIINVRSPRCLSFTPCRTSKQRIVAGSAAPASRSGT